MEQAEQVEMSCDVAVVGGGTAGTMAAITAAELGADQTWSAVRDGLTGAGEDLFRARWP